MPRRTLPVVLVAGLVLAVAPAGAAVAEELPTGTFTMDRMNLAAVQPPGDLRTQEQPAQDVYADALVRPPLVTANGVRLDHPSGTQVTLAPPQTQPEFIAGTTFPVGGWQSATQGLFSAAAFCGPGNETGYWGIGTATVTAATYTDGALTELAADVSWRCYENPTWENLHSSIRIGNATAYPLVRARIVGDPPVAGVGGTVPVTVRVDNLGTTAAALGPPALDLTVAGSYGITDDGCGSRALAPGEGCDVAVAFTPASYGSSNGWLGGLLWVPVEGYPRAAGVPARLGGRAVPQPTGPAKVEVVHGAGGLVVLTSGHPTHGGTTSYEFARRPGPDAPWETVGTRPAGAVQTGYVGITDASIEPGASAEYAVRPHGPLGIGGYTTPVAAARLASQVAGDVDAIVFDTDGTHPGPRVLDADDGLTMEAAGGDVRGWTTGGVTAGVSVRLYPQPGTFAVASHYLYGNSQSCTVDGTLTVHAALYDEQGRPVAYSADFTGTCNGWPFTYSARFNAAQPYRAVEVSAPATPWYVQVGGSADRTFTLTAAGSVPVTFGAASTTWTRAAEYSVVANDCLDRTLARGESCAVTVRAAPTAAGERPAQLAVVADTPRGARHVWLRAKGVTPPPAPYPVSVYRVVGRTRVAWEPGWRDGGAPITGYRVYRSTNGGAWRLLATVPHVPEPATITYDDTVTPGVRHAYAVATVNEVAEGPRQVTTSVRAPRGEVVFTHGAEGARGIYAQNARGNPGRFEVVADGANHVTPAVSPDGRTLVYSAPTANGYGLWRRTFATGATTLLTTSTGHEYQPAFSPDGRTIAFTRLPATGAPSVWTMPAAGGTPTRRTGAALDPTWLPDSETLVVVDAGSTLRLLKVTRGGTRTAIPGTLNGRDPAVSPDGKWLAYAQWHAVHKAWFLSVSPVTGGTPRYVQGGSSFEPAWRGDARRIYHTVTNEPDNSWVTSTGWSPETRGGFSAGAGITSGARDHSPAVRSLGLHLTSAPHVTGRTARIGFAITLPLPGEKTTCSLDGQAPVVCTSPWTRTGLAAGSHTLTIRSTVTGEPDTVTAHTWRVDATPPTVRLTAPGLVTLGPDVRVSYAATGAVSYDVRYRRGVGSGYSPYAYPASWQRTTATAQRLPVPAGTEVCFSVRARDAYGNLSAWSAERCGATAYDDRALAASAGWTRGTAAAAYLGTISTATTRGAALARSVTASRVFLVVSRCAGCGALDVTLGGRLLGRISTDGAAADRVVVALPRSAATTGTLRVTTASGARVRVDGVAVLRR